MDVYGIVGVGGFGREVMPIAVEMLERDCEARMFEILFVVEYGETVDINGHRVISIEEFMATKESKHFNIAIADPQVRERIATRLIAAGALPFSIKALNSVFLSSNIIGEGAIFSPFTTITSNVKIGRFFHANIYSYVGHDCNIGDFVTFAPNVHCNGKVTVEDYAYIGTGAIIRQGSKEKPIVIGHNAVVGMGAVVTKSVPPFATVVGNPAAPLVRG